MPIKSNQVSNPRDPDPQGEPTITLGVDVGGRDAHDATHELVLKLRKGLEATCTVPYGEVLTKIHLLVQIDGSVQSWGKSGVDRIFIRPSVGCATVDIWVPSVEWQTAARFRAFLASNVLEAIAKVGERAAQRGHPLALTRLSEDVEAAVQSFLSGEA
jgi:hypothetical protein